MLAAFATVLLACFCQAEQPENPAPAPTPAHTPEPPVPPAPTRDSTQFTGRTVHLLGDAIAAPDTAGTPVRYSASFINTQVDQAGDRTDKSASMADPAGFDYEIFIKLNPDRKIVFLTDENYRFSFNAEGTAIVGLEKDEEPVWAGVGREGVYRIRINSKTGGAALKRAESVRYLQPSRETNAVLTYEGGGVWKGEQIPFGWTHHEGWGTNSDFIFRFQMYYNETDTWQCYSRYDTDPYGLQIQPVKGDGTWENGLSAEQNTAINGYTTSNYKATVRLQLKAAGYTYAFSDIEELPGYTALSATSSEETFQMHPTGTDNTFDGVSSFVSGATVNLVATDRKGQPHELSTTATVDGPAYFRANPLDGTYTFLPLPTLSPEGNAVKGFGVSGPSISYAGHGVYSGSGLVFPGASEGNPETMTPTYPFSRFGRARFDFKSASNRDAMFRRVKGTRTSLGFKLKEGGSVVIDDNTESEEMQINPGTYDITVNLRDFTYSITPAHDVTKRITVMGSSVPTGTGATDNKGYMYLYAKNALTSGWLLSNRSVPGNNTVSLAARYDDLQTDGGKYVIFALSLGNEGIHGASDQQAVYNQWKNNMQALIARSRTEGRSVIVTGNYGRGDFNASDYAKVKAMNLEIHQWDVPSVNLLGAVDDGEGHWPNGYQNGDDVSHPNDAGHAEMSYTLVPSLFDAMSDGKPQPVRNTSGERDLSASSLVFEPEATVHPFTVAFYVKTTSSADLLRVETGAGAETKLNAAVLHVNDGNWHLVALTHYYAKGVTNVYVDGILQKQAPERLVPTKFTFGGGSFRELFFWRSGMNAEEINAVGDGGMLKSSLELYAPLSQGSIANQAQSTNTLRVLN